MGEVIWYPAASSDSPRRIQVTVCADTILPWMVPRTSMMPAALLTCCFEAR